MLVRTVVALGWFALLIGLRVAAVALFVLLAGLTAGCVRVPGAQVCASVTSGSRLDRADPSATASVCVDLARDGR